MLLEVVYLDTLRVNICPLLSIFYASHLLDYLLRQVVPPIGYEETMARYNPVNRS